MKLLFTEGIGASQTTTNAQDEKIPVYETKAAAEADIANLSEGQIIATKDEGNEMFNPVDVVESGNMHAVTSNAVAEALSYSTEEVNTGKKWIDGKPIYRKVLNINGYPATIQTGLTSANEVVGMVCKNTVSGSDNNFVFGGILTDNNIYFPWAYQLSSDNTTLSKITYTYSGTVKFIILEYTKTN